MVPNRKWPWPFVIGIPCLYLFDTYMLRCSCRLGSDEIVLSWFWWDCAVLVLIYWVTYIHSPVLFLSFATTYWYQVRYCRLQVCSFISREMAEMLSWWHSCFLVTAAVPVILWNIWRWAHVFSLCCLQWLMHILTLHADYGALSWFRMGFWYLAWYSDVLLNIT